MLLSISLVSAALLTLAEAAPAGCCKDPIVRKEWYVQVHFAHMSIISNLFQQESTIRSSTAWIYRCCQMSPIQALQNGKRVRRCTVSLRWFPSSTHRQSVTESHPHGGMHTEFSPESTISKFLLGAIFAVAPYLPLTLWKWPKKYLWL